MEQLLLIVLIIVLSLMLFGFLWLTSALLWGAAARALRGRSKAPWRNFDQDAERLPRAVNPEEEREQKR